MRCWKIWESLVVEDYFDDFMQLVCWNLLDKLDRLLSDGFVVEGFNVLQKFKRNDGVLNDLVLLCGVCK